MYKWYLNYEERCRVEMESLKPDRQLIAVNPAECLQTTDSWGKTFGNILRETTSALGLVMRAVSALLTTDNNACAVSRGQQMRE